jgi:hypothetical protein
MNVRVTAAPPGEAPLHIRKAWIGVVLRVVEGSEPVTLVGQGILTGTQSWFGQLFAVFRGRFVTELGYPVSAPEAISTLAQVNPEAAAWWRENAPHMLKADKEFIFAASVCEPVPPAD